MCASNMDQQTPRWVTPRFDLNVRDREPNDSDARRLAASRTRAEMRG
jgi:hypothetical protein